VQISLRLELNDKPGQLLAAIKPISDIGANIITILHQREVVTDDGMLVVDIVLTLPENRLEQLRENLLANGIGVVRVGTQYLTYTKAVILIGHILHTDLTDTITRIDRPKKAEVTELHLIMPDIDKPSTAKFTIKAAGEVEMDEAFRVLEEIALEKDLLIIDDVGGLE
jgi:ACT domain-containing protein